MIKLNSRGITTIEVILCFVLVFIMTFSMYGTVSSYNDKRIIEKDKNEILSYKYLLTKTIQDDFVNNELSHVSIENNFEPSGKKTYILHCTLKNGTKKILKIEQTLGYSTYNPTGLKNQSDFFMISYGTEGNLIEYPLPNLGSSTVKADPSNGISEHTIQELSIQDVKIEVLEHQVLSIKIVFYHPNFGNKYEISIMAPVNYVPDINLPLTSYTLLYDDNGGSGCHDKSIHKMEDDYWGELCTPTKANYTFLGWNTKTDGTGSTITAESKVTNNITVHAKWKKNQVFILLNANGGTISNPDHGYTLDADGIIYYNGSKNIHIIPSGEKLTDAGLTNWNSDKYLHLQKTGHTINSNEVWNTMPNGTGKSFDHATAYPASDFCDTSGGDCTITLYANWKASTYTISYDSNGGSLPSSGVPKSYTYGVGATINGKPTKSGYTFAGWNTTNSLAGSKFAQSISTTDTGNKSFYAEWCQNCASVANGSCSLTTNEGSCSYTTSCNTGYNLTSGASTRSPTCTIKTFKVTYNKNGGTGTMNNTTCNYDTNCTLRTNAFTRTGYAFTGWYTAATGGTKVTSVKITSDTTVYAQWGKLPTCSISITSPEKAVYKGWYNSNVSIKLKTNDATTYGIGNKKHITDNNTVFTAKKEGSNTYYGFVKNQYGENDCSITVKIDTSPPEIVKVSNTYNGKIAKKYWTDNKDAAYLNTLSFYDGYYFVWKDPHSGGPANNNQNLAYFKVKTEFPDGQENTWYSGIFDGEGNYAGKGTNNDIPDLFGIFVKKGTNKPSKIYIKYHLCDALNNCTNGTKTYTYTVGK